ncbi:uncharacterized protein LOC123307147 [Coccinella septempunctata]|uniref:uncharacterized protein LOC123307147 n=1 Tax=Coccinella septempunctata TaxID=41139 RepID=UPI001D06D54D|nr:uncharacterized protein LOC123307147 [Coccinella septempunctata]
MGFYSDILILFGLNVVIHFKKWASDNSKLVRAINSRIFLLRCRKSGVFPKHIINETQWLSDVKNSVRLSLCNIIHNFYRRLDTCKIRDGLSRTLLFWYDKTRLFLKNHSDIYVLNSDKGNKTVILSRVEYDEKLRQLLSDTSTYKLLRSDPTKKIQVSGNKLISELHTGGFINDREAKSMKQYNSLPPKIYGLVKIHKSNRPLRPVISCCNSPTFDISKFLVSVLDGIRY